MYAIHLSIMYSDTIYYLFFFPQNVSSFILRAENNRTSSPPHFDCSYRLTVRIFHPQKYSENNCDSTACVVPENKVESDSFIKLLISYGYKERLASICYNSLGSKGHGAPLAKSSGNMHIVITKLCMPSTLFPFLPLNLSSSDEITSRI